MSVFHSRLLSLHWTVVLIVFSLFSANAHLQAKQVSFNICCFWCLLFDNIIWIYFTCKPICMIWLSLIFWNPHNRIYNSRVSLGERRIFLSFYSFSFVFLLQCAFVLHIRTYENIKHVLSMPDNGLIFFSVRGAGLWSD